MPLTMKTGEIVIFLLLCAFQRSTAACRENTILRSAYSRVKLSASSEYTLSPISHGAFNSRLNTHVSATHTGAWSAQTSERGQWIQADLGEVFEIEAIASQGRPIHNQYVTSYTVKHSEDGRAWVNYGEDNANNQKVFRGNSDHVSVVKHLLAQPMKARFVRLYPMAWFDHISLRWELYGCPVRAARGILTSPEVTFTASSEHTSFHYHGVQNSRLYTESTAIRTSAWSASENKVGEYIEADLGKNYKVAAIATQGRSDSHYEPHQWVTSYFLTYSTDGLDWVRIAMLFAGNSDEITVKENPVVPPIVARYVRLYPHTYHVHMSLRWDLYGNDEDTCRAREDEIFPFGDCSASCGQGTRGRVFSCTFANNGTRRIIHETEICNANVPCPNNV